METRFCGELKEYARAPFRSLRHSCGAMIEGASRSRVLVALVGGVRHRYRGARGHAMYVHVRFMTRQALFSTRVCFVRGYMSL